MQLDILTRIENIFQQEFVLHPKARLIDYFKLFIQSAFGPGHLVKDIDSARKYLLTECNSCDSLLIQECEVWQPYARYHLGLIKKQIIPFDDFFNAFIETANQSILHEDNVIDYWYISLPFLKNKDLEIFEYDCGIIDAQIKSKQFLVRHSYTYNINYNPAYRIVNKKFLTNFCV